MQILEVVQQLKQYTAQELMDKFVYTQDTVDLMERRHTNKQIADYKNQIDYDEHKAVDYKYDNTRRPKLLLKNLRQMRKKNDARKIEVADHKKFIHFMYGDKDNELSDELRIDLMKSKLDNETTLQRELIRQRSELEKEKLKQQTELQKAKLKIQADAQDERLNRQADAKEWALQQQADIRKERSKAQESLLRNYPHE